MRPIPVAATPRSRPTTVFIVIISVVFFGASVALGLFTGPRSHTATQVNGAALGVIGGSSSNPAAVTKQFLEAVDSADGAKMKALARGEIYDEIDLILASPGSISFAGATYSMLKVESITGKVSSGGLTGQAAVVRVGVKVDDQPEPGDVLLLDDGKGYKLCHIDDPDSFEDLADAVATHC